LKPLRRCFFGDYSDSSAEPDARQYQEISDVPKLLTTMEEYLMDFNGTSKRPMNLAIFLFAVEHVSRICRLLKQPGGHMLLVGVGGSGRQSLTRLAAHIAGMDVHQVGAFNRFLMGFVLILFDDEVWTLVMLLQFSRLRFTNGIVPFCYGII
jgi:dynein heavy chain